MSRFPKPTEISNIYNPNNFSEIVNEAEGLSESEAKALFAQKNRNNVFTETQIFNSSLQLNDNFIVNNQSITPSTLLTLNNPDLDKIINQNTVSGTNNLVDTVTEDLNTKNITVTSNKVITQQAPTSGDNWNLLQKTQISDLEVLNSLVIPSDITIEGSTHTEDLVLNSNASIQQVNNNETNTLGATDFYGTIVKFNGDIEQINAGSTSSLKNLTVSGDCILPTASELNGPTLRRYMNLKSGDTYGFYIDYNTHLSTNDFDVRLAFDNVTQTTAGKGRLVCSGNFHVSENITGPTIDTINNNVTQNTNDIATNMTRCTDLETVTGPLTRSGTFIGINKATPEFNLDIGSGSIRCQSINFYSDQYQIRTAPSQLAFYSNNPNGQGVGFYIGGQTEETMKLTTGNVVHCRSVIYANWNEKVATENFTNGLITPLDTRVTNMENGSFNNNINLPINRSLYIGSLRFHYAANTSSYIDYDNNSTFNFRNNGIKTVLQLHHTNSFFDCNLNVKDNLTCENDIFANTNKKVATEEHVDSLLDPIELNISSHDLRIVTLEARTDIYDTNNITILNVNNNMTFNSLSTYGFYQDWQNASNNGNDFDVRLQISNGVVANGEGQLNCFGFFRVTKDLTVDGDINVNNTTFSQLQTDIINIRADLDVLRINQNNLATNINTGGGGGGGSVGGFFGLDENYNEDQTIVISGDIPVENKQTVWTQFTTGSVPHIFTFTLPGREYSDFKISAIFRTPTTNIDCQDDEMIYNLNINESADETVSTSVSYQYNKVSGVLTLYCLPGNVSVYKGKVYGDFYPTFTDATNNTLTTQTGFVTRWITEVWVKFKVDG